MLSVGKGVTNQVSNPEKVVVDPDLLEAYDVVTSASVGQVPANGCQTVLALLGDKLQAPIVVHSRIARVENDQFIVPWLLVELCLSNG